MISFFISLILNFCVIFYKDIYKIFKNFNIKNINISLNEFYATSEFLDLLILNLESGHNLYQAFALARNYAIDAEIQKIANRILFKHYLGTPFFECLKETATKQQNPYFNDMLETIVISLQLGTPIQNALHDLSKALKMQAILKMEECAAQAAVKMVFPLVLFIFPVIFILLGSGSIQDLIISLRF